MPRILRAFFFLSAQSRAEAAAFRMMKLGQAIIHGSASNETKELSFVLRFFPARARPFRKVFLPRRKMRGFLADNEKKERISTSHDGYGPSLVNGHGASVLCFLSRRAQVHPLMLRAVRAPMRVLAQTP
jgi:hypothetical protein